VFVAVAEGRNLRRRRRQTDGEPEKLSVWDKIKQFAGKLKRQTSQAVIDVKDSVTKVSDQVAEASKKFATDPQTFMAELDKNLPKEFFTDVMATLKRMGLDPTDPKNVEYVIQFSLVAAGVPSFFADKMAKPLTSQLFKLLGKDVNDRQGETENKQIAGVNIDLSQISENNGNMKLNLVPGSKASLGEPMEDGRTPVLLQIVGQLEYIPPMVADNTQQFPAIAA